MNTKKLGHPLYLLDTVGSTNDEARARLAEGEGVAVAAKRQLAGRGSKGRSWDSAEGDLFLSVVLKPTVPMEELSSLTLAAGLAVCGLLEGVTDTKPQLKWPNDVLLHNKKICGILTEAVLAPDDSISVVLGLGLNVNRSTFPEELRESATSLLVETGQAFDIALLLPALLEELEQVYDRFCRGGFACLREDYCLRSAVLGREVTITCGKESFTGKAAEILENGALAVDTPAGRRLVDSGEATLRERKN